MAKVRKPKIETATRKNRGRVIQPELLTTLGPKCDHCKKEFEPRNKITRFCSVPCRNKFHGNKPRAKKKEIRMCIICASEYECRKDSTGMTCGKECLRKRLALPK